MSIHELSARFAQVFGLLAGLLGAALWAGSRVQIPFVTGLSESFRDAGGTDAFAVIVALIGFATSLICTVLFALLGTGLRTMHDLRESGWK